MAELIPWDPETLGHLSPSHWPVIKGPGRQGHSYQPEVYRLRDHFPVAKGKEQGDFSLHTEAFECRFSPPVLHVFVYLWSSHSKNSFKVVVLTHLWDVFTTYFFFGWAIWPMGSSFPNQGLSQGQQWECRVETSGPPGNSLKYLS